MNLLIKALLIYFLSSSCYADTGSVINLARLSLDEATKQILKEGNKRVLGATTEIINGKEVHVIKVLTPDGRIHYYKIDAETGAKVG